MFLWWQCCLQEENYSSRRRKEFLEGQCAAYSIVRAMIGSYHGFELGLCACSYLKIKMKVLKRLATKLKKQKREIKKQKLKVRQNENNQSLLKNKPFSNLYIVSLSWDMPKWMEGQFSFRVSWKHGGISVFSFFIFFSFWEKNPSL